MFDISCFEIDETTISNWKRVVYDFFSYLGVFIFYSTARLHHIVYIFLLYIQQRLCRRYDPKKTDLPLYSIHIRTEKMHPVLSETVNSSEEEREESVEISLYEKTRTDGDSQPKLCTTLIQYESYVVQGGKRSLSGWMEGNGHQVDNIDLPHSVFSYARYSATPIQDLAISQDVDTKMSILHANGKLETLQLSNGIENQNSIRSSGREEIPTQHSQLQKIDSTPKKSLAKYPEEQYTQNLKNVNIVETCSDLRKLDFQSPSSTSILQKSSGMKSMGKEKEEKEEEKKKKKKMKDTTDEKIDIHTKIESRLHQHWIVWGASPKWIPESVDELTKEQQIEIYEICHFLGYNLGIAWHPDSEALIDDSVLLQMHKSEGKMAMSTIPKKSAGKIHPVSFSMEILSKSPDDRISIANSCIHAGGAYFIGWGDWMESGGIDLETSADKKMMANYFGITEKTIPKTVKAGGCAMSVMENIEILTNHAEMSLKDYRLKSPAFLGWLISLPNFETRGEKYRETNMSKQDVADIMAMGLFFCWLPLTVSAINSISKLDAYEFNKITTDANRRKIEEHILGMDAILQNAMQLQKSSISDPIHADAIDQAMKNINSTLRASYYIFSQKVCAAVSRFSVRQHILHNMRSHSLKGEEYTKKLLAIQKMSGGKWKSVVSKIENN